MELNEMIDRDHIIPSLRAKDKQQLLKDLAHRAATDTGLGENRVLSALQGREQLGSTGVGNGIAISHARIAGLKRFYALFARLEQPVDYASIDDKPVDLVYFLLTPDAEDCNHIAVLAAASRRLRDPATVKAVRASKAEKLYDCLVDMSG